MILCIYREGATNSHGWSTSYKRTTSQIWVQKNPLFVVIV